MKITLEQTDVEYKLHDLVLFDGTDDNGKRVDKHGIVVGYELVAYDSDPNFHLDEICAPTRFYYRIRMGDGVISIRPGQILGIDMDRN